LVLRALLALVGFVLLVLLGTWQLERKAWKEALIDTLSRRLAAEPAQLPDVGTWPRLDPSEMEFRPVHLRAELLEAKEALVFTNGSALRDDARGPGYWVFTPARLAEGSIVMIDRGFVPEGRQDPATRRQGELDGMLDIVGVMRWPEPRGFFTPKDDPARNLWFVRDPTAIAAAKNLGPVAPFYVEQESPVPPGGLPSPARLTPHLPNNHLQYAITWYGLAAVLAAVFGAFAWSSWRQGARVRGAG